MEKLKFTIGQQLAFDCYGVTVIGEFIRKFNTPTGVMIEIKTIQDALLDNVGEIQYVNEAFLIN